MMIPPDKTKCIVKSKESIRCKLQLNKRIIKQIKKFNCLGVEVTRATNIIKEVIIQTNKAAKVGDLWNNMEKQTYGHGKQYGNIQNSAETYFNVCNRNKRKKNLNFVCHCWMKTISTIFMNVRIFKYCLHLIKVLRTETTRALIQVLEIVFFIVLIKKRCFSKV